MEATLQEGAKVTRVARAAKAIANELPAGSPRVASREEIEQLKAYLSLSTYRGAEDVASDLVDNAAIAVFPSYMTDTPGYTGKLLVIIYGGGSENVETYIWCREEIERASL